MKNKAVSTILSSYVMIMTLVYALLTAIFLDDARGEEDSRINDADSNSKTSISKLIDKSCKSPCPPNAEMCIQMCA